MKFPVTYDESIRHVEQLLACLSTYVELSNSQGTSDINVSCENIAVLLLNAAYGYKLENYNGKRHVSNAAGLDLLDTENGICVQVTSNQSKKKFDDTVRLCKENPFLKGYRLLFFIINTRASKAMRSRKDEELGFDGDRDVIDFRTFCDSLKSMSHERVIELDSRIGSWLGNRYYAYDQFEPAVKYSEHSIGGFSKLPSYYPRRVVAHTSEDVSFYVNRFLYPDKYKEHTLKDYVLGEVEGYDGRYWLLVAAGQSGKTFETKNLCAELVGEPDVFPVFYEAKNYNKAQDIYVPSFWQPDHIVLVVDGYDEISSEDLRACFLTQLEEIMFLCPGMRIVLTSRRNYISSESVLPEFRRLYLEDLSFEDVKAIVGRSGIENPERFLRQVGDRGIYSQVYIPFYLNALLDCYRREKQIPDNRHSVYRFLIEKSFNADACKKKGAVVSVRLNGYRLLRQIALVMQFTEKKELTNNDVIDMGLSESDMESCLSYMLFHKGDNECYRFEQNAFQLYFVSEHLASLEVEKVLDLISHRSLGINRIKPEWLDAFELMLSMMPDGKEKSSLLEWTYENHTEALLNVDTSYLNQAFCHKVFRTILLEYKAKRISSSPEFRGSFDRKLAGFCLGRESLELFLDEYRGAVELGPYLYFLSFVFWSISSDVIRAYGFERAYKDEAYRKLVEYGNEIESKWCEAPYAPFENPLFANSEDISRLIGMLPSIDRIHLKKVIFNLIDESESYDEFVDFSINHESSVHDYCRARDSVSVSVSRDKVFAVLGNVSQYEGIKKIWEYIPLMLKNEYGYNDSGIKRILPSLLRNTEVLLHEHPDLKELVDAAWIAEYNEHHYYRGIRDKDNLFDTFNVFMAAHSDMGEVKSLIDGLRLLCLDMRPYKEKASLAARILVRMNPGDMTALSESWESDEGYRDVMLWLRSVPSQTLYDEIDGLVQNRYPDYLASLQQPDEYGCKLLSDRNVAFDRKRFVKYISDVLEKYGVTNRKELRLQLKEDEELELNNYLWQYLGMFRKDGSDGYDEDAVKKSLRSRIHYSLFIMNTFHDADQPPLTVKQVDILKKSVVTLLESKRYVLNDAGYRICTEIIAKYGADVCEEKTLECLRYASKEDYWSYVIDRYGFASVKPYILSLLKKESDRISQDVLNMCFQYVARYSVCEAFNDVMRHICTVRFPVNLADCFYKNSGDRGRVFLMGRFDELPAEVQLYVVSEVIKEGDRRDWVLEAIHRNRGSYTEAQSAKSIAWLVYLGDDWALYQCVEAVREGGKALWEVYDVPPFRYADTKYLPQIMELIRLTWDLPGNMNNWYSRLCETLRMMSRQDIGQFNEVVTALEELVDSDLKYSTVNYFIGELRCNHEHLAAGAKPMTVKEAVRLLQM